jgi:putative redox protein
MKGRVKWVENAMFLAESGSGHAIVMDGPPESGGKNLGVRPMEMLLFDVVHILKKGRHSVLGCEAFLEAERAESDPKVFTKIHLHFQVSGQGLTEAVVERAVHLSAEKYCSASIMLGKSAQVSHSFEIVQA